MDDSPRLGVAAVVDVEVVKNLYWVRKYGRSIDKAQQALGQLLARVTGRSARLGVPRVVSEHLEQAAVELEEVCRISPIVRDLDALLDNLARKHGILEVLVPACVTAALVKGRFEGGDLVPPYASPTSTQDNGAAKDRLRSISKLDLPDDQTEFNRELLAFCELSFADYLITSNKTLLELSENPGLQALLPKKLVICSPGRFVEIATGDLLPDVLHKASPDSRAIAQCITAAYDLEPSALVQIGYVAHTFNLAPIGDLSKKPLLHYYHVIPPAKEDFVEVVPELPITVIGWAVSPGLKIKQLEHRKEPIPELNYELASELWGRVDSDLRHASQALSSSFHKLIGVPGVSTAAEGRKLVELQSDVDMLLHVPRRDIQRRTVKKVLSVGGKLNEALSDAGKTAAIDDLRVLKGACQSWLALADTAHEAEGQRWLGVTAEIHRQSLSKDARVAVGLDAVLLDQRVGLSGQQTLQKLDSLPVEPDRAKAEYKRYRTAKTLLQQRSAVSSAISLVEGNIAKVLEDIVGPDKTPSGLANLVNELRKCPEFHGSSIVRDVVKRVDRVLRPYRNEISHRALDGLDEYEVRFVGENLFAVLSELGRTRRRSSEELSIPKVALGTRAGDPRHFPRRRLRDAALPADEDLREAAARGRRRAHALAVARPGRADQSRA